MKMKKIYFLVALLPLTTSCMDGLREIYDRTDSVIHVEGSWSHSLGVNDMHNATVMLHHADGARNKHFLSRANGVTAHVVDGDYDVLVFNGVMESENSTNLDHIRFRGTDNLETFEVYSVDVPPMMRLSRTEDEYIASNSMELFTFAHHTVSVDGDDAIYVRYRRGERTDEGLEDYVAGTVSTTPRALSFRYRITLTNIVNPTSASTAAGAMRGFLGSLFVPASGERPRPGFKATHHLTLTPPTRSRVRTRADGEEVGTLTTPQFVSFGPTMPTRGVPSPATGEYFFEPVFGLRDGTEHRTGPIDITAQVNATIERMLGHHDDDEHISHAENDFEIVIDDEVFLPPISGDGGIPVDVEPWPDDEIIIVWI